MVSQANVHLFLCSQGRMLPRWREAFGAAHAAKPGTPRSKKDIQKVDLIWLRLEQGVPVGDQLRAMKAQFGFTPCVVLSDIPSDEEALGAFSSGARGYCNTHSVPSLLQQIADVALQGGLWIGESLMQRLVTATAHVPLPPGKTVTQAPSWPHLLTEREIEVARTLATGASNKEIARALGITDRTVKSHVGSILEKLQVRDRLQLSLVINGRVGEPQKSSVT